MKKVIKVNALAGLVAGVLVSASAVNAQMINVDVSANYGSSGAMGGDLQITQFLGEFSTKENVFLTYNGRYSKLDSDNYIRKVDANINKAFNRYITAYIGAGLLITDVDKKIDFGSTKPIATFGAKLSTNVLHTYLEIDAYIHDAHAYGVRATLPLFSYTFDSSKFLLSAYAETNKMTVEQNLAKQPLGYHPITNEPFYDAHAKDVVGQSEKTIQNVGVQLTYSF